MTYSAGDLVIVGARQRYYEVTAVLPSGKLQLSTGAIVPAGGVRRATLSEAVQWRVAVRRRRIARARETNRLWRDLTDLLDVPYRPLLSEDDE